MQDLATKPAPLSVRLPAEVSAQVTALAATLDRSKSWVIEQAVKDYVAWQSWQLAVIDEGIAQADAGQLVAHADVAGWARSLGKPDELPRPE